MLAMRFCALLAALCVATPSPLVAASTENVALNCECVPFFQCDEENRIITDGADIFDVKNRLGEVRVFNVSHADCPKDNGIGKKCCAIPPGAGQGETSQTTVFMRQQEHVEVQEETRLCGTQGGSAVVGPATSKRIGVGEFGDADSSVGEFPWMLALLEKTVEPKVDKFRCGASLIHPRVALTAAHCVFEDRDPSRYVVRAGEYDTSTTDEALPHQDRDVIEILVPDNFNAKALYHDTALLHLETAFDLDDHIAPVCLPEAADLFDGEACVATGWGRQSTEGAYSPVLRKVDLRMVARLTCQTALRTTRLGRYFLLDPSFVCAQGELGADTCDGDGGSPLICPLREDPQRWAQTGITAWGVGCGGDVPSVYANVASSRRWMDTQLLAWGYGINDNLDVSPRVAMTIDQIFNTKTRQ